MLSTVTSCLLRVCRSVDALRRLVILLVLAALVPVMRAAAAAQAKRHYDLSAGDAATTLRQFIEQSGEQVMYLVPKVRGVKTHAVRGEYTAREAIDRMLANTVLVVEQDERSGALMIHRAARSAIPDSPKADSKPKPNTTSHPQTMKRKNPIALLGVWLALAFSPVHAAEGGAAGPAAATGTIAGYVSNAGTGAYLEGAEVALQPGNVSALTARDGRFTFSGLQPGEYTVTASYTGLDAKTIRARVEAGRAAAHDIALTAEIYTLSTFVVEGEREGNALAITQQRNAPNIKNVVSSDAFGTVADLNIGNFLQRLPGFSTEMSEGEIIRIQIRGTGADLNAISTDGTRVANGTSRTFSRGMDIDRISADFIESIEVTKAMTPDLDADSIGGSVNLKTKSALDRKGRRITYNLGHNYNVAQRTFRPIGSVGYSNIFQEGRLGLLFTASYNESHKPRDEKFFHWEATTDTSRPAWFNVNGFGQDQLRHQRAGAGVRVDYKLSDTARIYVERFFDSEYRYRSNDKSVPKHAGITPQFMNIWSVRDESLRAPQLFSQNLVTSTRDSIRNNATASEAVSAAYIMGDPRLGRLGVVGGVRVEETRLKGNGYRQEITPEESARRDAWTGPVTPEESVRRTLAEFGNEVRGSARYHDYFPSLHFKFHLTKNLIARASYSTGIGRPNFSQIVPVISVNHDAMTLTANNPDLRPQYSDNYDAMLEYYFRPSGLASIGVFEKRLSNFIYRERRGELGPDNDYGDEYTGYTLTSDLNGGSARIRGLEVSLQQQFSDLPGFWRGFGVFANFTRLETAGEYRAPGQSVTQNEVPNFKPRSGNVGVSYIAHGWTIRAMANYTSEFLLSYNANPALRQYTTSAMPLDVNIAYAISPRLRLYADVINVFNVGRQDTYVYTPDRPLFTLVYTPVIKFGISGSF